MALPPRVELAVTAPAEVDWDEARSGAGRTLVLVRTVAAAVTVDTGLDLAAHEIPLNVGVVQHTPGRRPITSGIHLSGDEVEALAGLAYRGVKVELRSLPDQPPLTVDDARARFLKAG